MTGLGGRRWWVYLGVVAALATAAAVDPSGLRRYLRLRGDVATMRAENAALAAENAALSREVRALRSDPAAIERAVREELHFVRPGERVYVLEERGGAP